MVSGEDFPPSQSISSMANMDHPKLKKGTVFLRELGQLIQGHLGSVGFPKMGKSPIAGYSWMVFVRENPMKNG